MNTDLPEHIKVFLDFYQWLDFNRSLGDESYLDFAKFMFEMDQYMINNEIDLNKLPKRTNMNNIASRYFEISQNVDINSIRKKIFLLDDLVIRNNKFTLRD